MSKKRSKEIAANIPQGWINNSDIGSFVLGRERDDEERDREIANINKWARLGEETEFSPYMDTSLARMVFDLLKQALSLRSDIDISKVNKYSNLVFYLEKNGLDNKTISSLIGAIISIQSLYIMITENSQREQKLEKDILEDLTEMLGLEMRLLVDFFLYAELFADKDLLLEKFGMVFQEDWYVGSAMKAQGISSGKNSSK